jgi:hypothetical protein
MGSRSCAETSGTNHPLTEGSVPEARRRYGILTRLTVGACVCLNIPHLSLGAASPCFAVGCAVRCCRPTLPVGACSDRLACLTEHVLHNGGGPISVVKCHVYCSVNGAALCQSEHDWVLRVRYNVLLPFTLSLPSAPPVSYSRL